MSAPASVASATNRHAPKISVLVPTHNYARYLPEALDSVLAQDCGDYELIISDDASTDASPDIVRHYAARDPRIRAVIHTANLGMVENWNGCLRQARGRYIKFLFGDDRLVATDALSSLARLLDTHPTATLAASPRLLIGAHSEVTGIADELSAGLHDGAELIAHCLRRRTNLIGEPSTVMFRRDAAARGFDPHFRQIVDLELWFHLLLRGRLAYAATPLCAFRRHETQQTQVNHRSFFPHLEMLQLLDRYLAEPTVRSHLQPGSLACRRLAFCQRHYARKAVRHHPQFTTALAQLNRELPWHWNFVCWLLHRTSRPFENLRRKLRSRAQRHSHRGTVASLPVFP